MKSGALVSVPAFGIATLGGIQAHDGHKHPEEKVIGTVVQVHQADGVTHIEVKTPKGDTVVLTAGDTTKYLKGKTATTLAEIKPGSRIVAKVTKDGEVTKASEITLGSMDSGAAHPHGSDHPPGTNQEHDHKH